MTFDGFYFAYVNWFGTTTLTRQFNFPSPVDVYAFGALTAVVVTGGEGCAFVGISEVTLIDPNTGRPINKVTPIVGQQFPSPSVVEDKVTSVTFEFGSNIPPANHIQYANASLTILLRSS
jgi:hypothetical protein